MLHIPATSRSLLAQILDRAGPLPAEQAEHGTPLTAGRIYVAPRRPPPARAAATGSSSIAGRRRTASRPAVDPLFRSLAASWGRRGIAVVLSGALDDGASGVVTVADAGGTVVVQDPADALVPSMPENALDASPTRWSRHGRAGRLLARLVSQPAPEEAVIVPDVHGFQTDLTRGRPDGPASGFTCPECSGALWELREGELVRHCRVGHTYSRRRSSTTRRSRWRRRCGPRSRCSRSAASSCAASPRMSDHPGGALPRRRAEALERAELIRGALALRAPADDVEEASAG